MFGKRKGTEIDKIINGCIKNDRKSQKILYDQYFERLYEHCQSYRLSEVDSISLINATMLKVFQNIQSFNRQGALGSWIHMIHKRVILDHFRQLNRQKDIHNPELVTLNGSTFDENKSWSDIEYIKQAMNDLPKKSQKVLKLYAIEGYSHKEIAKKLKISEGTSKWHLNKARHLMSEMLKKDNE
ncbi:RNA polymerase sigma factor [Membranihabitans maritimus]|uniref:RNA polymerase sigma factor n=1 Tax=Membranihabitans maritimus TaxID=2904244 RepID=UPI001F23C4CD|nr:RNA polymerase sigma factor [Membranihabitans maritimus]